MPWFLSQICFYSTTNEIHTLYQQDAHDLQSKTVWYVDEEETPDTVSYSTTIVGGVILRVPIERYTKLLDKIIQFVRKRKIMMIGHFKSLADVFMSCVSLGFFYVFNILM